MKQSGNALFLILIAVALFAALSYAVTQSGRGGGSIDREQLSLEASRLLQYGAQIANAVERLKLINGCSSSELSFDHPGRANFNTATWYLNPLSPADESCHVFEPEGGAVTVQTPIPNAAAEGATEYIFSGDWSINGLGATACSADAREIIMVAPVSEAMCTYINSLNDVSTMPTNAAGIITLPDNGLQSFPNETNFCGNSFGNAGTFANGGSLGVLAGMVTGCAYDSSDDDYYFYYAVLVQ